jgi:hypothetical protein
MTRSVSRRQRAILQRLATVKAQQKGAEAFEVLAETNPLPGSELPMGVLLGLCAAVLTPAHPSAQGFLAAFAGDQIKRRRLGK